MSRVCLTACLALGALASPAYATAERATIAVTLTVEPSCAATVAPASNDRKEPEVVVCAGAPARPTFASKSEQPPAYTVRTIRGRNGTVLAIDF